MLRFFDSERGSGRVEAVMPLSDDRGSGRITLTIE
ncbi:hypothetical protein NIES4071_91430 [Calothrix sp. NIES-4071]|nr:hypothetical protein NIES4071_91430 [Calothrix sp. NIES-4071]BAZ63410.1 hypothetical protein NIES4105_91360 [Calothrix sp. NIES-4105]